MTLNLWNFSAEVKKFGTMRGTDNGQPANWGKLWILVKLDDVIIPAATPFQQTNNTLFINAELDYAADSSKQKASNAILNQLKEGAFLFIKEAKLAEIQKSRKKEDGTYEPYKEIGVKASVFDMTVSGTRFPSINLGLVSGKVIGQNNNTIIVEDTYLIPNRGRHSRRIPIILPIEMANKDLSGKYPFITAKLCGKNPNNEDRVFGVASHLIV